MTALSEHLGQDEGITVKPDVLLIGTLQTPTATLVFD